MKLAFIGGGNMGEAMLSRIVAQKLSTRESIIVSDVNEARRQYLEKTYGEKDLYRRGLLG